MADYSLTNSEGELVKMGMLKLWLRCLTAMEYVTSFIMTFFFDFDLIYLLQLSSSSFNS